LIWSRKSQTCVNGAKLVQAGTSFSGQKSYFSRSNIRICLNIWTILRSFGLVYLTWTTCSFQSAYLREAEEKAKPKSFPQTEACFTRLRPTRYFGGQTML